MLLSDVYIGHTKDGKERCIIKKNKVLVGGFGDIKFYNYFDLETKEELSLTFVDESTVKQFVQKIYIDKKRMFRRKIVKTYQADRNKMIDTRKVFYGDIIKVYRAFNSFKNIVLQENRLFESGVDVCRRVLDIHSYQLYEMGRNSSSTFSVKKKRDINYQQFDEFMQPKRKLLEMDYRKEL